VLENKKKYLEKLSSKRQKCYLGTCNPFVISSRLFSGLSYVAWKGTIILNQAAHIFQNQEDTSKF